MAKKRTTKKKTPSATKAPKKTTAKKTAKKRKAPATTAKTGGISDDAVKKATGKTWAQWLKLLDAAGGKAMNHKEIVAVVHAQHAEIGGWWQQMVTVGYEQARGLRVKHEKPEGFEISVSKTLNVPIAKAYAAWTNARTRAKWLDKSFEIRKATKNKTMRNTWSDGTHVDVYFWDKGANKCQVAVQHRKLKTAAAGETKKNFWSAKLGALKCILES